MKDDTLLLSASLVKSFVSSDDLNLWSLKETKRNNHMMSRLDVTLKN